MKFADIQASVGHVPFILQDNAKYLYNLILQHNLTQIIELGIAHGTATCYMAAALHELGVGRITAVDLIEAADFFHPTPEEQLKNTGLEGFAEIIRMQSGYNWFLHNKIRQNTNNGMCKPEYDLCIIDGSKNWTIEGAAFFFVDKLLKPGGWIIFDDFFWTYAYADTLRKSTDGISHRSLSKDEIETSHIREIFDLLVVQHPSYSNFKVLNESNWGIAQKVPGIEKTYTIIHSHEETYKDLAAKVFDKLRRAIRRAQSA